MTEQIRLRYSDNGGGTWSQYITMEMADVGDYMRNYNWQRLGMARDRIFEVSWVSNKPIALNGAFVDFDRLKK